MSAVCIRYKPLFFASKAEVQSKVEMQSQAIKLISFGTTGNQPGMWIEH